MSQGVKCEKCGERIYPHEVMFMISLNRKEDNIYLHGTCFNDSLAKRLQEDLLKYWDVIAILKSGEYK